LPNLKHYQLGSEWKSYIKIGLKNVESIHPLQNYVVQTNDAQHLPSLDKWMIYSKDNGFISFKDYTVSKGSHIRLPILKKYVQYYNSHYSYIENLLD